MEYDVIFSVDLCELFHTCFQGRWFFICCPLIRIWSRLFFSMKGLFFWFVVFVCLCEEKLFFISDIWGSGGHLDGYCLDIFPDFETCFLRDFKLKSGENVSCSVDWTSKVCYTEVIFQHIITCIPECWWDCLCLKKWLTDFLSARTIVGFLAAYRMCANSINAI